MDRGRRVAFVCAVLACGALAVAVARRDAGLVCRDGLERAGPRCCVRVDERGACASSVSDALALAPLRVTFSGAGAELRGDSFERPNAATHPVHPAPFALASLEVTCADALAVLGTDASAVTTRLCAGDLARVAGGLRFSDAERICTALGGRVPREAEWRRAAAANGTRYPWGESGATCRVAVWSMASGPCAHGLDGPDTAHARPGGASPEGLWDLAGNAAEWVSGEAGPRVVGGDYASLDAAELRVLAGRAAAPEEPDPRHGVRCAFDRR
jgi:formylglycine-generating enzyme required for sulfatase activity